MLVLLDHDVSPALGIMNSYPTHPPLNEVKFAYVKLYQWQESPKSMVGDTTGVKILKKTDLFVPIFFVCETSPMQFASGAGSHTSPFFEAVWILFAQLFWHRRSADGNVKRSKLYFWNSVANGIKASAHSSGLQIASPAHILRGLSNVAGLKNVTRQFLNN